MYRKHQAQCLAHKPLVNMITDCATVGVLGTVVGDRDGKMTRAAGFTLRLGSGKTLIKYIRVSGRC